MPEARVVPFVAPTTALPSRAVPTDGDDAHDLVVVENTAGVMANVPEGVDLVPGVYEGGLKVWESSVDLVRYLRRQAPHQRPTHRVLELGCGHGLPGIEALRQGAAFVAFLDLNEEVLRHVTAPNIALNVAQADSARIRLVSGDWTSASALLEPPALFEVVLSAETFYTPEVTAKLLDTVQRHLARPHGRALLAGKRYYFGTGGSVAELVAKAGALGFQARVVDSVEDGKSNIRDVVELTWKEER